MEKYTTTKNLCLREDVEKNKWENVLSGFFLEITHKPQKLKSAKIPKTSNLDQILKKLILLHRNDFISKCLKSNYLGKK